MRVLARNIVSLLLPPVAFALLLQYLSIFHLYGHDYGAKHPMVMITDIVHLYVQEHINLRTDDPDHHGTISTLLS